MLTHFRPQSGLGNDSTSMFRGTVSLEKRCTFEAPVSGTVENKADSGSTLILCGKEVSAVQTGLGQCTLISQVK